MSKLFALLGLALVSTSVLAEAPRFACSGTEPFWTLYLNSEQITFMTPSEAGMDKTRHDVVAFQSPINRMEGTRFVYQTRTRDTSKPATIVITKGTCSDGMSDASYPYSALYVSGTTVVEGCCYKNN